MNAAEPYWNQRFTEGQNHHSQQNREISTDFLAKIHPDFDTELGMAKRIIEFGCGTGELSRMIHEKYDVDVLGTDFSPRAITYAQENHRSHRLDYRVLDVLTDEIPNSIGAVNYGLAICSNVVEHFRDPYVFIDKILDVCPRLILLVPFNQPCTDGYENEGGAGHVFQFTLESFSRYKIISYYTFSSSGWQHSSAGETPLQLSILLEAK